MKRSSIVRIASGFRVSFIQDSITQTEAWTTLMTKLSEDPFPTFAEAMRDEDYMVDDWLKGLPPNVMLYNAMQSGELFACFYGQKLAAITLLTNIIRQREGTLEAWVMPEFRGEYCVWEFWAALRNYAFRPFRNEIGTDQDISNSGLDLRKIKCTISRANPEAFKACARMGFFQVGMSPQDGLYNGQLTDMLMLELPNPRYFPALKAANNDRRKQQSTRATYVRTTSAIRAAEPVPERTGPEPGDRERVLQSKPSSRTRRTNTKQPARVDAVEQQPDEPRRNSSVRAKLVRPKRRTTGGTE